ncbi:hypothetical protein ATANTOWER_021379 [Ataeniobius toweri]|uniref:Uncharacterized protein n=1 Tax=Ataeniobius toweri TaxID=208326 RepID=A0ABU7CIR8_9TELE|nr:hypothetical protein [Ataeniobius toweri]
MGAFWHTNGSKLNPCTFSSIYSSKCSVCLNDSARPVTVLVVLRNLTSSVNLVMEGPNGHISFNRTDCPGPETMEVWGFSTRSPGLGVSKPRGVGGRIGLFISLAFFVVLLIIILIIGLKCNRQNSQI